MKIRQWRPSTALKKRRSKYLSQVDVTGVASIFFFFVFMFLGLIGVPDIPRSISVDSPVSTHALSPNALKEDNHRYRRYKRRADLFLQHKNVARRPSRAD
jgi:hypothetical protein